MIFKKVWVIETLYNTLTFHFSILGDFNDTLIKSLYTEASKHFTWSSNTVAASKLQSTKRPTT